MVTARECKAELRTGNWLWVLSSTTDALLDLRLGFRSPVKRDFPADGAGEKAFAGTQVGDLPQPVLGELEM